MMDHLGHDHIGKLIVDSIEAVLVDGNIRTPDLGGTATTVEMGDAIISKMAQLAVGHNL